MEGRRHGRGWGEVGDAGGCGARARRNVPASGGCRRGAGWKGWESHCVGPLRELFHVSSSVCVICRIDDSAAAGPQEKSTPFYNPIICEHTQHTIKS